MGFFSLDRLRSMSPLGAATLPIAVDFGSQTLKAIQLSPGAQPGLLAAASMSVPENIAADPSKRLAWQVEQLPKLLKSAAFKGKRAACSIPCAQLFCKHLQVNIPDKAAANDIVVSTVAAQLKCDPSVLAVRHIEVDNPSTGAKTEVIAMAASRGVVQRLMDALKACKLEPVGIHPEPMALLRAFDHVNRRPGEEAVTTLYLDLGYSFTKVVIAHGHEMVFCKTIQLGGRYLDQAVARQTNSSPQEARAIRLGLTTLSKPTGVTMSAARAQSAPAPAAPSMTGIPALDAQLRREAAAQSATAAPEAAPQASPEPQRAGPAVDLSEPLETLTDEIALCLRYYEALFPQRRVNRAVFIGGEARHLGLCQHVARTLRLPAQVADPLARVTKPAGVSSSGVDVGQAQPGWAVALGVALSPTDL